MQRRLNKFSSFCCYEIDTFDNEIRQIQEDKMPMRTRMEYSKIQFQNLEYYSKEPTSQLLSELYAQTTSEKQIYAQLRKKRLSSLDSQERDDLEHFIPQLVTYFVIEKNLEDLQLSRLLFDMCTQDIYFAHRMYFYLKSLSYNHNGEPVDKICYFIEKQFIACRTQEQTTRGHSQGSLLSLVQKYGCSQFPDLMQTYPVSLIQVSHRPFKVEGFLDTPIFWQQIMSFGSAISEAGPSKGKSVLQELLCNLNSKLPANVYIPFFKNQIRTHSILAVWKGHIFYTKERAPFSIWLEICNERQDQIQILDQFQQQNSLQFQQKNKKNNNFLKKIYEVLSNSFKKKQDKQFPKIKQISKKKSIGNRKKQAKSYNSFGQRSYQNAIQHEDKVYSDNAQQNEKYLQINDQNLQEQKLIDDFFPQKSSQIIQERKKRSIYRNIKNWRLIHLLVKIKDDIKQEQFAMQLINRFNFIFKEQKTSCVIFPYEVISLGYDCGLIQMFNDVITLDKLFQKIAQSRWTLRDFFENYFHDKKKAARNFMKSLAGYSLISYFLQIKDRHNGNILLHKEGYIIHIDFGFFLSNNPGKGVQLQKKMPFKLLSEYVQVIGGLHSEGFFEFRRLFLEGFRAIIRHRQSIMSLVQVMYSSHGQIMNCFIRGQEALLELQQRLNPPQDIELFCYNLVNKSLDNWRAKWYDKFQYLLQKIYY